MFDKKLFGSRIDPSCRYCAQGTPTQDGLAILCLRRGVMGPTTLPQVPVRPPSAGPGDRIPPCRSFPVPISSCKCCYGPQKGVPDLKRLLSCLAAVMLAAALIRSRAKADVPVPSDVVA